MPDVETSLVAGPQARLVHRQKVAKVLGFLHKVHVGTTAVIARLLGATSSNANRLVQQMVEAGLLRQVEIRHAAQAPRGKGYLLTPLGLSAACANVAEKAHDYDCRPESIRHAQLDHDLFLAEFAATWVRYGGELLETDYTQRGREREGKIPDLVLRYEKRRVAVELERLVKKRRELDVAIHSAYESHTLPTIWLSPNACDVQYLKYAVHAEQIVDRWTLDKSNKWTKSGCQRLLLTFRARQAFELIPEDVMLRTPEQWIHTIEQNAIRINESALNDLLEMGWTWSNTSVIEWEGRSLLQFELRIDTLVASALFYVTQMQPDTWRVCRADQTPDRGASLIETFKWAGKEGVAPPLTVVELATWRIKSCNFHLPD